MKTTGQELKEIRIKKKYSRSLLAEETRIKKEFIEALEAQNWDALPEYPVVVGFVKNISTALRIDAKRMVALLRRDYPPKALRVNPKPDLKTKFFWSPRLTFWLGVGLALFLILGYLSFQYVKFISPPELVVDGPRDGALAGGDKLKVFGRVDPDATLKVNNQPVLVDELGNFSTEIEISEMTEEIEVVAKSRSGKETLVRRKIKAESNN